MGFPHNSLKFPYKRQSPSSKKMVVFKSIDDVWKEVLALCEQWVDNPFSLGRNLYFHLPLFCNPKWLINEQDIILLKEFSWAKEFNIPIAKSLEDVDSKKLDYFDLISQEITEIKQYISEKQ